MYECESWTTKKAECWRIDAFELWCWRRLLRDPWTARRSNLSILKEINPEYSVEGPLMLKQKLHYFGHLKWRADSLEDSDAGKDWRQEEMEAMEDEMVSSIADSMDTSLSKFWEIMKDREVWCPEVHAVTAKSPKSQTLLSDWTTTT